MKRMSLIAAIGAVVALGFAGEAKAHFFNPAVEAPALVESVQCRTVTVRERVGGRTVVRKRTTCAPRAGVAVRPSVVVRPSCRTVRTRVVGAGGRVTFRTVRRC